MTGLVNVVELAMVDGSLHRYLGGHVPEGAYLSARNVFSYNTGPEQVARYGLAPGKGQIVQPLVRVMTVASGSGAPPDSPPPSAAPQEEAHMSAAQAISELAKIARTPGHPKRDSARRAILALPDGAGAQTRVAGAAYTSEHAEALDRIMGLSTAGQGTRVEGSQLILSAAGRRRR